jgi:hypothetical protein
MAATAIVSLGGLALTALLAFSGTRTPTEISPQGCRMSFMSPSYILQTGLDTSWTPRAGRYSLWLYREVGWDSNCKVRMVFSSRRLYPIELTVKPG